MKAAKPTNNRVIIKLTTEKKKETIILVETKQEEPKGTVVSIGPKVTEVKPGDKVLFEKWGAEELELKGEKHIIIKEDVILAIIT